MLDFLSLFLKDLTYSKTSLGFNLKLLMLKDFFKLRLKAYRVNASRALAIALESSLVKVILKDFKIVE